MPVKIIGEPEISPSEICLTHGTPLSRMVYFTLQVIP
jgi:hypothetical protein